MQDENLNQEPQKEDVEPVKLGKSKTGIICVAVIFCAIIVCLTIRGCSISKEVKSPSSSSDVTISQEENNGKTPTNVQDTKVKNSENTTSSTESSSTSSKDVTKDNSEVKDSETVVKQEPTTNTTSNKGTDSNSKSLTVVDSPILGSSIDTTGIVSGKTTYLIGTSYLYEVSIVVVTGNNESSICKYYCPKNTYDALSMGDSLNVTYQADSTGNSSISTISK